MEPKVVLTQAFSEHKSSVELHSICKSLILEGYTDTEELSNIVSEQLNTLSDDDEYEEELLCIGDMLDGHCSKKWSLINHKNESYEAREDNKFPWYPFLCGWCFGTLFWTLIFVVYGG